MNSDTLIAYEQLSPEEAARIDAVCDRFEKAWKETKADSALPETTSYLDQVDGPSRAILIEELAAIEKACRKRYGMDVDPRDTKEVRAGAGVPTNGRPTTDAISRLPPADWPRIPGLELLEVLGSGGMGVVFRARQPLLDREVAVKVLRADYRADTERRERFLQEARAVARLRHSHLVQLYEFGEVPGLGGATSQPYLVLEYVSGGSLADLLRGSPQSPAEAARLVETLADAIHYAHQQGVIHRDLKPANILLQVASSQQPVASRQSPQKSTTGYRLLATGYSPKITDFGLAKFLTGSDLTRTGDVLGTPSYMAPEQAAAIPGPISPAVDIYGLGAIFYESLTGRPPFAAATVEATLGLVRQDDPIPPRRLQPTVPRDLETICLKCLRKEPGRRYATALDLAEDLRRFLSGKPVRARPVGAGERVVVWCRRKPGVAALLAALVFVVLAGSSGVLWQWRRATLGRDAANRQKERAEHHLRIVHDRVAELERLGHDLLRKPATYRAGQAVLQDALAFYQELLPEEGADPEVRREALQLYGQVAWIHHTLDQAGKAAEAWARQASLMSSLLEEDPGNKTLRMELSDCLRWRGNALLDQGKPEEARQPYDQAARLQEELLREFPGEPHYRVALANTLINATNLLSLKNDAEKLDSNTRRVVELDREAVRALPDNAQFASELALALEARGRFLLKTGQKKEAEVPLGEARDIYQGLLAGKRLKGIEHYAARNHVAIGRMQAETGRQQEAEKSYRKAVDLLDGLVETGPEAVYARADLARALAALADLLKEPDRRQEALEIRRRALSHCEFLKANYPEGAGHRLNLVRSYLRFVNSLWELNRQTEATETFRKALEVDPEDPELNNDLAWFLAVNPEITVGDTALAVRLASKSVVVQPKSPDYRNTLGAAHYRNGNNKAAVDELNEAVRLKAGGDGLDCFLLAMAHWRLGARDEARKWFDQALQWMDKNKPNDDELRRFRAEAEAMLNEGHSRRAQ